MAAQTSTLNTASAMARTLVERQADINELAKMAAYLRTHLDGRKFFRLLETLIKDGHLVRSRSTIEHYRSIQEVCHQHLEPYRQARGAQAQEGAEILGWTVRLMRYHKEIGTLPVQRPVSRISSPPTIKQDAPPQSAREVSGREVLTLTQDAKNRKATGETKDGERFVCTDLPAYPPPKQGAQCRAEVTRRDGKVLRAIFKAWE